MLEKFLISVGTLFAIVDPITLVGIFLSMTANQTVSQRKQTVNRAIVISTVVLFVCAIVGEGLLKVFGITLPAFQIAGGVLLFLVAFDMIYARPMGTKQTSEEEQESAHKEDVAVFPLAIPLLAGPGAVVSVFILMNSADSLLEQFSVIMSIAVTMFASWLILRSSQSIERVFGKIGMHTFSRVMGIVLAAISVQFLINGLKEVFPKL